VHRNQQDVLRIVRIWGPMSNAEIAARMPAVECDSKRTHGILKALVNDGYIVKLHTASYDVSNLGRAKFNTFNESLS